MQYNQGMSDAYPDVLRPLFTLGDPRALPGGDWPDYLAQGLTAEQVPDLVRLATDKALHWDGAERPDIWAPLHAWRTLGQLRAEAAAAPLLAALPAYSESDWFMDELPEVLGLIGESALPQLSAFLADSAHDLYERAVVGSGLEKIGLKHPGVRAACVVILRSQLERHAENDSTLNAFLIANLSDLKATEAAPIMEKAFAADDVDLGVCGDWEDVQIDLGLLAGRLTPRPRYNVLSDLIPGNRGLSQTSGASGAQKARKKAKRQAAKAARRKNRR